MAKIRIKHRREGYIEIFKSAGVQAVVDEAGRRIEGNANAGYSRPYFKYYPKPGKFTSGGFVSSTGPTGAYYEATDGALSKAVR